MTNEEITQFKNEIAKSIMPYAINMNEEQIKNLINQVQKENEELPEGFGNMVYEQILIMKYNN